MRLDLPPPDAADPAASALLARVRAVPLSAPDDPLGFEMRLADDQGWSLGHALAVVDEYRRFLVLTQLAGGPVCPARDVDAAWHLHLTRTADYARLCREALGGFLHHDPAGPGDGEAARHRAMYVETLAAYRRLFGHDAPPAVWPLREAPEVASPPAAGWAVPSWLRGRRRVGLATMLAAVEVGALLRQGGVSDALPRIPGPAFLVLATAVTVLAAWLSRRRAAGAAAARRRDALDPYEAAWLAGGERRMASTALARLVEAGYLRRRPGPAAPGQAPLVLDATRPLDGLHPVEQAALRAQADGGVWPRAVIPAIDAQAQALRRRLVAAGLAGDPGVLPRRRGQAVAILAILVAVEAERFLHGLQAERPSGLLLVLLLVQAWLSVRIADRRPRATPRGEVQLDRLRRAARPPRRALVPTPAGAPAPAHPGLRYAVALFGAGALASGAWAADPRFLGLHGELSDAVLGLRGPGRARGSDAGGGSACSSSCSSSSCSSSSCGSGGGSSCGGGSGCGGGGCSS
jgi:uncharacterized protein (TIGR04222 family)